MTAIAGRIRQTLQLVFAWGRSVEDDLARRYLTHAEYGLYIRMSRAARQHHLRVLKTLLTQGHSQPALLKAALLHDIGKVRYRFSLPEKVLVVLTKAILPKQFEQWGDSPPQGWKRPFVVSAKHPEWSAEMGAAVGLDHLTLELIRRHQDRIVEPHTEADHLLLLLQAADNRS